MLAPGRGRDRVDVFWQAEVWPTSSWRLRGLSALPCVAMGLGLNHAPMLPKELFPVPNFASDAVGCGTSRSSHRRHNARSHRDCWQSDCIRTLNTMAGYGAAATPSVLNSAQSCCVEFVRDAFLRQAYPGDDASGEALLGLSSSAYAAGRQCGLACSWQSSCSP